jgi:hypothetical protein
VGEHVLTQHDLEACRTKHDSIGMAGYNIDIREIQWVAVPVPRFPTMQGSTRASGSGARSCRWRTRAGASAPSPAPPGTSGRGPGSR